MERGRHEGGQSELVYGPEDLIRGLLRMVKVRTRQD